jgi:3,4-dihydroxy-9,10-secoandrosta-1,3,5(10)-triene-9,17-dione 4,5-dioxygenase
VELYHGGDLDYAKFISPQGIASFETGFNGNAGLGHIVLPAPNRLEAYRFYTEVIGAGNTDYMHFRFSAEPDDPGVGLHFLHLKNPRHHSIALFGAEHPAGCIHIMLEVKEIDEVGYCLDRVMQRGIPVVSTLGRHTNDRMLSFYMRTPAGFELEFGCDGSKMDWTNYTPTVTSLPSIWGHKHSA